MDRIAMKTPLVEIDGDEMTRVIWRQIKEELILPFVELRSDYYDLGLTARDQTRDQVTTDAANAILRHGVGVKCATITPNARQFEEYGLREMWPSPNATIRAMLDGTVFRAPILIDTIPPAVRGWKKPIAIARHAYGDVYKGSEYRVPEEGRAELLFHGSGGQQFRRTVYDFEGPGVVQATFNKDSSIRSFARACFAYAADTRQDLWFSSKDTISKVYDQRFKDVFAEVYAAEYRERFETLGLNYFYTLIDDAVARVIRSGGGFIWALKNYDGDVMSDMVAAAFGSLAMMTSVLVSPGGQYEYEAAHGTVTRHYQRYLAGEECSTNPMATLFAWSGALKKRAELDALPALAAFGEALETAALQALRDGVMTADLARLAESGPSEPVTTLAFLRAVRERLAFPPPSTP